LWCEGGHLHKECPEKGKYIFHTNMLQIASWRKERKPVLRQLWGCRYAKEEMQKRK
jgi:hypothetical protein